MDYIPVYEGQADDGVAVTLSPGKLQRTGVRSEKVERRTLSEVVRAPGEVAEDERRISVVSVRSDSFTRVDPGRQGSAHGARGASEGCLDTTAESRRAGAPTHGWGC